MSSMRAPAPRPVHTYQREATPSEHAQWDKAAPKLGLPVGKAGTAVDLWLNKQVRKVYLKTINARNFKYPVIVFLPEDRKCYKLGEIPVREALAGRIYREQRPEEAPNPQGWNANCQTHDLPPGLAGARFDHNGKEYIVLDIKTRRKKFPILAKQVLTGKTFKFNPYVLRRALAERKVFAANPLGGALLGGAVGGAVGGASAAGDTSMSAGGSSSSESDEDEEEDDTGPAALCKDIILFCNKLVEVGVDPSATDELPDRVKAGLEALAAMAGGRKDFVRGAMAMWCALRTDKAQGAGSGTPTADVSQQAPSTKPPAETPTKSTADVTNTPPPTLKKPLDKNACVNYVALLLSRKSPAYKGLDRYSDKVMSAAEAEVSAVVDANGGYNSKAAKAALRKRCKALGDPTA